MGKSIDVLLAEDDLHDAELTIRAFRKYNPGIELVHLRDGEEALDFLYCQGIYNSRDENEVPRLVLLDLKMPKVDGMEVLKTVKADDSKKVIPVVILTSSREEKDVAESYRSGANSYVVKPLDFKEFIDTVSELGRYWLSSNQAPF